MSTRAPFQTWLTLGVIKWIFAATSAITFALGSCIDDKNQWISLVWRLSAFSGLLAFICETEMARRDRKESEQLQSKVAELNLLAEQERLRRLVVEERLAKLAPRYLTDEQQSRLKEMLANIGPQNYLVCVNWDNSEARQFSLQLNRFLKTCGWKGRQEFFRDNRLQISAGIMAAPSDADMTNMINHGGKDAFVDIAFFLNDSFERAGIKVSRDGFAGMTNDFLRSGEIGILVGPTPTPNLMAWIHGLPEELPPQPPPQTPP